jgi:F0F1-type ATP synthase membrane subunit a
MQINPIHQFEIKNFFSVINLGGYQISFTNSALYMFIVVGLISALLIGGTMRRAVVPGRLQSIAEMTYEFIANTVRSSAGSEGMRFFPFVFTLFMFVLGANLIGLNPYSFTVTSQLIITVTFALLVFFIVVGYGFWKNGLHFLNRTACDCSPTCWPATSRCRFLPALSSCSGARGYSASSALRCRSSWWCYCSRSSFWWRSCRLMCSRFSLASRSAE